MARFVILHRFSGQFLQRTKRAGVLAPDGVIGVIETGLVDSAVDNPNDASGYSSLLRQALASLPEGTWELVCHPGYNDADLRAARTRLLDSREAERRLLTSPELRQFLEDQKTQVISYREFAEGLRIEVAETIRDDSRSPKRCLTRYYFSYLCNVAWHQRAV